MEMISSSSAVSSSFKSSFKVALKEWAIATHALARGETILLLRKGGIKEKTFALEHHRFWLYPTYEHQKPELLIPAYAEQVQPVISGWHPESIEIQAWAELTHFFQINQTRAIEALFPFHIWNALFVQERLQWKSQQPLSVLLLRVYRLSSVQSIPFHSDYGGCKSWIELRDDLSIEDSEPVLLEKEYADRVQTIQTTIDFYE